MLVFLVAAGLFDTTGVAVVTPAARTVAFPAALSTTAVFA